jgi:hypothetical protein
MISANRTVLALCLMIAVSNTLAKEADLRLCTALATGNYHASGQEIARQVKRSGITVRLVETTGSMDNLERMAANECDAGIVQKDAYLVYQDLHRQERLDIRRPRHLYDEFVHLVCRRDSGIESIQDLSNQPAAHTLLVGPSRSGGAITWTSFRLLDSTYSEVKTGDIELDGALQLVRSAEASCLMFVSGLRSKYSSSIDQSGDLLRLVAVDDPDFDKAKFAGRPIYSFKDIPSDTYANLQAPSGSRVKTLTVRAIFIINSDWAEAFPNAFELLIEGLARATPVIQDRVSAH